MSSPATMNFICPSNQHLVSKLLSHTLLRLKGWTHRRLNLLAGAVLTSLEKQKSKAITEEKHNVWVQHPFQLVGVAFLFFLIFRVVKRLYIASPLYNLLLSNCTTGRPQLLSHALHDQLYLADGNTTQIIVIEVIYELIYYHIL